MAKISCIICAYNEAPRIGSVLAAVAGHPLLEEVIVIDDGSVDATSETARSYPNVRVIRHEKNLGKSAAMAEGVRAACGDTLCLLDADLRELTPDDITALVRPVLSGRADVSLGLRKNSWRVLGLDPVAGERVIPKYLLDDAQLDMRRLPRFGIEVFINKRIIEQDLRIAVVRWNNTSHTFKIFKYGLLKGVRAELNMVPDVFSVHSPLTPFVQIYSLAIRRSDVPWAKWLRRTSPASMNGLIREFTSR